MTDASVRMTEAERAKAAYDQYLGPAFMSLKADYLSKLAEVAAKPMNDQHRAGMEKLAVGLKVIEQVETHVMSIIADGAAAQRQAERASQLANLTTEQRRWLSFAPAPL